MEGGGGVVFGQLHGPVGVSASVTQIASGQPRLLTHSAGAMLQPGPGQHGAGTARGRPALLITPSCPHEGR